MKVLLVVLLLAVFKTAAADFNPVNYEIHASLNRNANVPTYDPEAHRRRIEAIEAEAEQTEAIRQIILNNTLALDLVDLLGQKLCSSVIDERRCKPTEILCKPGFRKALQEGLLEKELKFGSFKEISGYDKLISTILECFESSAKTIYRQFVKNITELLLPSGIRRNE